MSVAGSQRDRAPGELRVIRVAVPGWGRPGCSVSRVGPVSAALGPWGPACCLLCGGGCLLGCRLFDSLWCSLNFLGRCLFCGLWFSIMHLPH